MCAILNIPFLDLRESNKDLQPVFQKVIEDSQFILGDHVGSFETAWARKCNARYCVGVDNGLEALRIALEACGIGEGDEVIVPSHTYIATWLAVSQLGARIVPVEPKAGKFVVETSDIQSKITSKTKAVIPVHLYGELCNMDGLMDLSRKYMFYVIEDAAQSHGSPMLGHIACYSFYPTKNLGAIGDAGAIVTNAQEIHDRAKLLRNYGAEEKDKYLIKGWNSRLDELQAAVLLSKLQNLDSMNRLRMDQALQYNRYLDIDGKPQIHHGVWHQYVIQSNQRDKLKWELYSKGIGTRVHYPTPPHKQECYSECSTWNLPVAENYAKTVLSLPLGYEFDVESVCKEVNDSARKLCQKKKNIYLS